MSNAIVSNVYRYVIDDVINGVRGEFEDMGIDEAVLTELQRSWEAKVARSRVANFGFSDETYFDEEGEEQNPAAQGDGMNPLQYNPLYGQPAAASLVSLASTSAAMRDQLKAESDGVRQPNSPSQQQQQQQQRQYMPDQRTLHLPQQQPQQPPPQGNGQPYSLLQQQQQQQQQQQPGDRPNHIPQIDGADDSDPTTMTTAQIDAHIEQLAFSATNGLGKAMPLEELPEDVKTLMRDARDRAVRAGAMRKSVRIPQLDGEGDGEDDINSDLDDSDDADDDADGGEEIEHIILCLYDKVTRTKNKWKCVLKDGIMLVNGRDYLFHRASGDFEW